MRARDIVATSLVAAGAVGLPTSLCAGDALTKCEPMPAVIHAEQPQYPNRESRVAVEGSVTLQFTIAKDGSVSEPAVISNDPADTADWFNAPALAAIALWKFQPVKTPCTGLATIVFKIVQRVSTHNKLLERTREDKVPSSYSSARGAQLNR
jgi:TonB family protein